MNQTAQHPADFLLRRSEVERIAGLSRASIYRLIKVGKFPAPVSLGTGSVRLETVVDSCLASELGHNWRGCAMTLQNGNAAQGLPTPAAQNQEHCAPLLNDCPAAVNQFIYSEPSSVKGRTLGAFLRGERLAHLDCWKRFGSARLAHHVHRLRKAGWPVEMVEQAVVTSDAKREALIGVYFLTQQTIETAGERGQRYAEECARVELDRRAA
ncbi:MAG: AlpA family phage regulatory protein [Nitrosomonadales bacterium]|nr:AlpA family phage regulatory protein [Nitrosomonadales bacterium]